MGSAGSGRTRLLVDRAVALAASGAPDVTVVCASPAAAGQFRQRLMARAAPGVEVVTSAELALRLARLGDPRLRLAPGWARSATVARLLADDGPSSWPVLRRWCERSAFASVIGSALAFRGQLAATEDELLACAERAGSRDRWREVLAFGRRVDEDLARRGLLDPAAVFERASRVLASTVVRSALTVLVDDADLQAPAVGALFNRLPLDGAAGRGDRGPPWWRERIAAGSGRLLEVRPPAPEGPDRLLVTCGHQAVEGETVVAALRSARAEGIPWADMAVAVTSGDMAAGVAAALDRHGLPCAPHLGPPDREPVAGAALELVAWAGSGEGGRLPSGPASLLGLDTAAANRLRSAVSEALGCDPDRADPVHVADALWRFGFSVLADRAAPGRAAPWNDRALDVAVALLSGMRQRAGADSGWMMGEERAWLARDLDGSGGPLRSVRPAPAGVMLIRVDDLGGARWSVVVLAGAVEGRLPRRTPASSLLPLDLPDRHPVAERARFDAAVDAARQRVVAVAATGPGVLVSRYVAGWARAEPARVAPIGSSKAQEKLRKNHLQAPQLSIRHRTPGAVPVFPLRRLVLSASQLATYENCPQRYAYQYPLGIRTRPGVWADVGSMVHAVLAEFHRGGDRSWLALERCLQNQWTDGIAPFAPQREEIRRDTTDLLRRWWDREWAPVTSGDDSDRRPAPDIVAVEHPFSIDIGEHTVVGRIDRVDRVEGGLAVIDYKTGARLPPAGDVVDDLQLALYHLAVTRDPELAALGPPVALRLRYLRAGVDFDQPIGADHAASTEARVLAVAERILAEAFDPSPLGDCDTCPFQRLCALHPPGRPVGPDPQMRPPEHPGVVVAHRRPKARTEVTLTDEQRVAVDHPRAPLRIVAGAGTGKTTVMASRVGALVERGLADGERILALTFTNKAVAELAGRVRDLVGPDAPVTVSTYHGFSGGLVASHLLELGLHPSTTLLDRAQAWQLLFGVFDEFRFSKRKVLKPGLVVADALQLADRCADHLVAIQAVMAHANTVVDTGRWARQRDAALGRSELCQVVEAYDLRKRQHHLIDFGDQIRLAVQLLADHPEAAGIIRRRYPIVLLDEYQDTNYAQRVLLEHLTGRPGGRPPAITAVGDDMQSIYAFRGAHRRNLTTFEASFPPVTDARLEINRRSGPEIVTLANRIQGQVPDALEKQLSALSGAPSSTIECFLAADDVEEAAELAADIAEAGRPWSESAVLCRKRKLIPAVVDALEGAGVPTEVVGTSGLLSRPEVVDVVCWLEILADPEASVPLMRLLRYPPAALGWRDLAALARAARQQETFAGVIVAAGGSTAELSADGRARVGELAELWAPLCEAANVLPVDELVETIIERRGLWTAVGAAGVENLLRLLQLAKDFEPRVGSAGLEGFVAYLQLLDEADEDVAEAHAGGVDAVQVMTVHQAKGLEWDRVWVPGLAGSSSDRRSGIFPDARGGDNPLTQQAALPWELRPDEPGHRDWRQPGVRLGDIEDDVRQRALEEEWRLLYVACTRARRRLVCSAAHWYPGPATPQGPSVFYEFVAGQRDLVGERFRHPPAVQDPREAAMARLAARAALAEAEAESSFGLAEGEGASPTPLFAALPGRGPGAATFPSVSSAVSVTSLVSYARCPRQFYWLTVRPLPRRGSVAADLGTRVHRWIQRRGQPQLALDVLDELPPLAGAGPSGQEEGLHAAFLASPYGQLAPVRVEAPFVLVAGGQIVRGRIDAAYERDGRLELVDFKTGQRPTLGDPGGHVQLDLYALAAVDSWAADPARLRTTFCYLRPDGSWEVDVDDWDRERIDAVRVALEQAVAAVSAGRFDTTPGAWCARCDWQEVCPAGQEWVLK